MNHDGGKMTDQSHGYFKQKETNGNRLAWHIKPARDDDGLGQISSKADWTELTHSQRHAYCRN